MKLNLSKPDEANKAEVYFAKLLKDGSKIELKKISPPRTINQNSYLHALMALFGGEFGWTIEQAKQVVKVRLGYVYEWHGETFYTETSRMNSKELTEFIDKFRNLSSDQGLYLPTSSEFGDNYFEVMKQVDIIESTQKQYSY